MLVYGHYDVQPIDPIELWESPPFEATVRDGKLFGRGAVDDKGQVVMHLAAIEAHLRVRGSLPVNVKVVVEGEEEIGSPNFDAAVERYRDAFASDLAVISDTAVYSENVPSLTTSLRGLVHWEVVVTGPSQDLHSGYFGGVVRNPIEALAAILTALKDDDGRVTVPGFYDGVDELDDVDRARLEALAYDEKREAEQLGVTELAGERGRSAARTALVSSDARVQRGVGRLQRARAARRSFRVGRKQNSRRDWSADKIRSACCASVDGIHRTHCARRACA